MFRWCGVERIEYWRIAREKGVRPEEILRAVNDGRLDGWHADTVAVDADQARALDLPPTTRWVTFDRYSKEMGISTPAIVLAVRAGELDGLNLGKRRRWVFVART